MQSDNRDGLSQANERLGQAVIKVEEAVQAGQPQEGGGEAKAAERPSAKAAENVVDAEFEEVAGDKRRP